MLYHLFHALEEYDLPGGRLFEYITFRSGLALVLSLFIAIVFGKKIIERLQLMQVGEIVRNLGLQGQMEKKGTPTMGGIIIIISILIPCLLLGKLDNVYMVLMIVATIWCGALGFADDYLKIKKHNKEGMKGKFKIVGQVGLGLIVGLTMYLSPSIVMNENVTVENKQTSEMVVKHKTETVKSTKTTIPFVKNHNFDYAMLTKWMGDHAQTGGWIVFILVTIFVVAAVSNGANLTDGLDGLATGTSAIIGVALAIMCYLGGNVIYSSYLNIMYIPDSGELVVYAAAFIGATIGFLWYNSFPAQVFMGDTGSLCLGGIIAVFAILIRKELLIPILCLTFFVEDISVMIQVAYYKYTRKKTGEGKRVFKMTPLHHHFQVPAGKVDALWQKPVNAIPESKIVMRFLIVAIFLAVITFVTLKVR
ncbi:MAG: phospho-N-acetylmuramoyl-pentapeptide-transferase [Sodaliphilus sp.]|mgnify:FL=1|jgi:phospho-N-acetylmuramoyl-pentapeptide-transferase|nr:phospho-N-acetylmuramoyl-pentapeptide-transferase [Muribaculaceae bacterium]MCI6079168.1 phospho-N-acetylmuramoyl-pentapeptide-transferase [Bacteroidales bacterium]MDY2592484.1 phospho-N-acetylmuramoyl-pentapeptide-transferase [Sodaliphilus sp.]HAO63548.1 phospho-N-acetylmuramoyl-pentapeptide-transferase [Porphyromonadaceae bacterium]MCI6146727.1 phospho-N-acetylmuramoyl-pentapeptide-transferase [Bacteroidales bacterium]